MKNLDIFKRRGKSPTPPTGTKYTAKYTKKHLGRTLAALTLTAAMLTGLLPANAAGSSTIEISTAKQLCDFSRSCTLDTWSQGKTVVLTADIDLTGAEFSPIPTFGGTFDGGGHTISGLSLTHSGSNQGLFRYIQEGAEVRDLKVSGQVAPAGSAKNVGGIVGCNRGTVQGCSFSGTVAGKNSVGGIAGANEGSGVLTSCSSSGSVSGEHFTGGIAGQNLGAASACVSRAQVNTREEEVSVSIDDWNWDDVNSAENFRAHTDSGGIAGYSTGILQSCENYGTVGYPHTGYNVGGIVGRQAGFLDSCRNYGTVYGRKDVGGVAGQVEPYLLLQFDKDTLQQLDGELDTLRGLLSQLGDEASHTGDLLNLHSDALDVHLETVRTGAHDIAGWTTDFADGTTDTVNELSARVTRTFDRLEPIMGDLAYAGDGLGDAFRRVSRILEDVDDASIWGKDAANAARTAFDQAAAAMGDAKTALGSIRAAIEALRGASDSREKAAAAAQLARGALTLKKALGQIEDAPKEAAKLLLRAQAAGLLDAKTAPEELNALAEAFHSSISAIDTIESGISGLLPGIGADGGDSSTDGGDSGADGSPGIGGLFPSLPDSGLRDRIENSLALLRQGLTEGAAAMDGLRSASGSVSSALDSLETFTSELDGTLNGFSRVFRDLDTAMSDASGAARRMEDLAAELADEPTLELPALDSNYTSTVDRIFSALDEVSDEVGGLRSDLSGSGDRLHSTADAVNNQLGVISDLLMDGYNDALQGPESDEHDYIEDISDTDEGHQGRIECAENHGTVEGDVDVGGIAGSMAIEYDLDPEDDIVSRGQRSTNFSYQTRAVLASCRNEGSVTAKKNHAGGIVGRMDLGRVSGCESYGAVASTDGQYVGGIAGASSSAVRDCWVKCPLTGKDYVGGIAGLGGDLSGCRAMADIHADGEFIGAVAGSADGMLSDNVFVSSGTGAVDGVSYAGQAEPVEYDAFTALDGLPDRFRTLTVTFLVDGEILSEVTTGFGGDLDEIPALPPREGQFGEWSDEDFSGLRADKVVEAVYSPYITVLESAASRDGLPLLLAEGKFDRHSSLECGPAAEAPSGAPGDPLSAKVSHSTETPGGHLLRVLADEDDNAVWVAADGQWRKADALRDGSYLVFSIDSDEAVFCTGRETNHGLTLLLAAGIAGLALIGLLRLRRRRRRRNAGNSAPLAPEQNAAAPKEPAAARK